MQYFKLDASAIDDCSSSSVTSGGPQFPLYISVGVKKAQGETNK